MCWIGLSVCFKSESIHPRTAVTISQRPCKAALHLPPHPAGGETTSPSRPRPPPILPGAPIACRDHRWTQAVVSISAPIGDRVQTMAEKAQKRWVRCLRKAYFYTPQEWKICSWSPEVGTKMVSYPGHSAWMVLKAQTWRSLRKEATKWV